MIEIQRAKGLTKKDIMKFEKALQKEREQLFGTQAIRARAERGHIVHGNTTTGHKKQ